MSRSLRVVAFIGLCVSAFAARTRPWWTAWAPPAFVQLEAESFKTLTPREQALAYWLTQASIAIDPIIYDQNSASGLRQKRLLEDSDAPPGCRSAAPVRKISDFTKLFWANRGNHNEMTAQKFLPEFTFEELKPRPPPAPGRRIQRQACLWRDRRQPGRPRPRTREPCAQSLFDPDFEPMITAKSPRGNLRHPAGQRQQLLPRRQPGRPEGLSRTSTR